MPLRAFDDDGSSNCFTIAKAIRYAVNNGAQVINMSFGLDTPCRVISTAIDYALARNVKLTVSAGNQNTSVPQFPASYPGVIATAATTIRDVKASFSNYGAHIFVDAPGVHIISAVPDNHYGIMSGTSYSAPIIAAVVARLLAEGVTGTGIASRLASGAININAQNPTFTGLLGAGRVNIRNSVCTQ
jgi:subtilisin family serine protease